MANFKEHFSFIEDNFKLCLKIFYLTLDFEEKKLNKKLEEIKLKKLKYKSFIEEEFLNFDLSSKNENELQELWDYIENINCVDKKENVYPEKNTTIQEFLCIDQITNMDSEINNLKNTKIQQNNFVQSKIQNYKITQQTTEQITQRTTHGLERTTNGQEDIALTSSQSSNLVSSKLEEAPIQGQAFICSPSKVKEQNVIDNLSTKIETDLLNQINNLLIKYTQVSSEYLARKLKISKEKIELHLEYLKDKEWFKDSKSNTWYVKNSEYPKKPFKKDNINTKLKNKKSYKEILPKNKLIENSNSLVEVLTFVLKSNYPKALTTKQVLKYIYSESEIKNWSKEEYKITYNFIMRRLGDGCRKPYGNWNAVNKGIYKYNK